MVPTQVSPRHTAGITGRNKYETIEAERDLGRDRVHEKIDRVFDSIRVDLYRVLWLGRACDLETITEVIYMDSAVIGQPTAVVQAVSHAQLQQRHLDCVSLSQAGPRPAREVWGSFHHQMFGLWFGCRARWRPA